MRELPLTRRWLRFRLRTLFVLAVFIALVVAQITSMVRVRRTVVENQALAAENATLRAETGRLTISDRSKVYVVAAPELDELTWRWKVWLPPGTWKVRATIDAVPSMGLPSSSTTLSADGGKVQNVVASVRRGASGDWQWL